MKNQLKWNTLTLAGILALAGCGGGGGGGVPAVGGGPGTDPGTGGGTTYYTATCLDGGVMTSFVSQTDANGKCPGTVPLVTTVPTPTYAAGSEELAAFNLINAERQRCGFGLLAQNTKLDAAAKAHARWVLHNNAPVHNEGAGSSYFTGVTSIDRGTFQGYEFYRTTYGRETTAYPAELPAGGTQGARSLLSAPYHAIALLDTWTDIGLGYSTSIEEGTGSTTSITSVLNIDYGVSRASSGTQLQVSGSSILTYPCQGTTGTAFTLKAESPSPVPGRDLNSAPVGTPTILISAPGNLLKISAASYTNTANGSSVPLLKPRDGAVDTSGLMSWNAGFVVPDVPLAPNTTYLVNITGLIYEKVINANSITASVGGTCTKGTWGATTDEVGLTCPSGIWVAMAGTPFTVNFTFTTGSTTSF